MTPPEPPVTYPTVPLSHLPSLVPLPPQLPTPPPLLPPSPLQTSPPEPEPGPPGPRQVPLLTRRGPRARPLDAEMCAHAAPFARWCRPAATARRELVAAAVVETLSGAAVSAGASLMRLLSCSAAALWAGALHVPSYLLGRSARPV